MSYYSAHSATVSSVVVYWNARILIHALTLCQCRHSKERRADRQEADAADADVEDGALNQRIALPKPKAKAKLRAKLIKGAVALPLEPTDTHMDPPRPPTRRKAKAAKVKPPPLARPVLPPPSAAFPDLMHDSDDECGHIVTGLASGSAMAASAPETNVPQVQARIRSNPEAGVPVRSPHLQSSSPVILPLAERLRLQLAAKASDVVVVQRRSRVHASPAVDLSLADDDVVGTSYRDLPNHHRDLGVAATGGPSQTTVLASQTTADRHARPRRQPISSHMAAAAGSGLFGMGDPLQLATSDKAGSSFARRSSHLPLQSHGSAGVGGASNAAKAMANLMADLTLGDNNIGSSPGSSGGSGRHGKSSPSGSRSSQGWSLSEASVVPGGQPHPLVGGSPECQMLSTPGSGSGLVSLPSTGGTVVSPATCGLARHETAGGSPSSGSPYPHEVARKRGRSSRKAHSPVRRQQQGPSSLNFQAVSSAATGSGQETPTLRPESRQRYGDQTKDAMTADTVFPEDDPIEIPDTVTPLPLRRRVEGVQLAMMAMVLDDAADEGKGSRAVSRAMPRESHTSMAWPPQRHVIEISSDEDLRPS